MYEGIYILDTNFKIQLWNKGAEAISGYKAEEVIGFCCKDNILVHTNLNQKKLCGTQGCITAKALKTQETKKEILYIHHKKGHRVKVVTRAFPIFDTKKQIIGVVEMFSNKSTQLSIDNKTKELQKHAMLDLLTGISTRRYFQIQLSGRIERLKRYKWTFGILFLDIDKFKSVNDTYGHAIGDKILKIVASSLQQGIRSFDIVSRWGGEEFVIAIENINKKQLKEIGQKLCKLVTLSYVTYKGEKIHVKISIGATIAKKDDSIKSLVHRADLLMYKSKEKGGDTVTID